MSERRRGVFFSVSLLSGIGLVLAAQGIARSTLEAPIFRVSHIEIHGKAPISGYRVKPPTSIFRIDLKGVAEALQRQHPTFEVEAVRRILPSRLVATFRERRVVAQLSTSSGFFPVSDTGTVMASGRPQPWAHLPILSIQGVSGSLKPGEGLNHPDFWMAMDLLGMFARERSTFGQGLSRIQSAGEHLSLWLDSGLEVRLSFRRLPTEWQRLIELVSRRRELLQEARYLDLRFDDPVIGPKPKASKGARKR